MGLAPGEEFCDCGEEHGKCVRISRLLDPPGIHFNEYVNGSCQGEDETSGVGRESGGGDEICQ